MSHIQKFLPLPVFSLPFLWFQFLPFPLLSKSSSTSFFICFLMFSSLLGRVFHILCTTMCKVCFYFIVWLETWTKYKKKVVLPSSIREPVFWNKCISKRKKEDHKITVNNKGFILKEWIHWPLKRLFSWQLCQHFILFSLYTYIIPFI